MKATILQLKTEYCKILIEGLMLGDGYKNKSGVYLYYTSSEKLADDVHIYFGLGCRNVTKIFIPKETDFVPILRAFDKYTYFADHNKYKNNYDFQLSLALLNNIYYMTNEATLLIENEQIFSAISQLNYSFYNKIDDLNVLKNNTDIQCIVGQNFIPFGKAQQPSLFDYADGVDTMEFLLGL